MRRLTGRLVAVPFAAWLLVGAGRARDPREWWQVVLEDIKRFDRLLTDRAAASKDGDKPLSRNNRVFCPHEDRSPLKVRYLYGPPDPNVADQPVYIAYYCEVEQVYWVHLEGGIGGFNLVTGPYRLGVASGTGVTTTRPLTTQTSRPAVSVLTLELQPREAGARHRVDAPIPLRLVFTNRSRLPLWLNTNLQAVTLQFQVVGPRVDLEPSGRGVLELPKPGDFARMEPGGQLVLDVDDLAGAQFRHRIRMPGTYLIRVTYRNQNDGSGVNVAGWTGSVTSDSLTIEVGGPR